MKSQKQNDAMRDRQRKLPMLIFLGMITLCNCNDDNPSPAADTSRCRIQHETTSLTGNEASWQYVYDKDGNPVSITRFNRYNQVTSVLDITLERIVRNSGNVTLATDYNADIFTALPSRAQVSITMDGITQSNYWTYTFFYDDKNRLIKISEHTADVPNDYEWDLKITYNDKDNVTQLQYEWTFGSQDPIPPITVSTYDDKPTPYGAIKSWKFLMNNFNWDNYDPEPVITALSRNNPLDYTMGTGNTRWERSMTYAYNEHDFPVERNNTNKNSTGEYTFIQTFAYQCE